MCDDPATVFRRKKDTSMGVGLTMLRDGRADAMVSAGLIFVNTNMAAAVACCVTMLYTWLRYKKPDVGMTLNAALAGLVAITAGCDAVTPVGAFFIGLIAAPEGIKALHEAHPDVDIYLGAEDDHLNENGYIVPGLGDAGDRIYGTK